MVTAVKTVFGCILDTPPDR